ncbi:hypothetical protein CEXT_99071 [Caerostris extrusa]|uniref:Uncharacterized protein n=1 Tax=Caerostris extrusa TaxID=172846 RepID=A0AAV4PHZ8_CAEEX|nr:hypothetical protein CEXT_99071 [Caerostris extrusa]
MFKIHLYLLSSLAREFLLSFTARRSAFFLICCCLGITSLIEFLESKQFTRSNLPKIPFHWTVLLTLNVRRRGGYEITHEDPFIFLVLEILKGLSKRRDHHGF